MASVCAVESEEDDIPEFVDDHSSSDSDSESENESEDEDILHGPCGGKVCGADPPPPALRTFIGQFVAKEFQLDDEELPTLYWGQVTQYLQDTRKFCVSTVLSHFLAIFFFFYKTLLHNIRVNVLHLTFERISFGSRQKFGIGIPGVSCIGVTGRLSGLKVETFGNF